MLNIFLHACFGQLDLINGVEDIPERQDKVKVRQDIVKVKVLGITFKRSGANPSDSITKIPLTALWKHAYSNILNILPPKKENFQIKNSDILYISAQNIDCVYSLEPPPWGGSNEYPQSYVFEQK